MGINEESKVIGNLIRKMNRHRSQQGFSLAEIMASLTIGALILIGVLGVYERAERSAEVVTSRLERFRLPSEVLQRISEDLDDIISSGSDTEVTIENAVSHGFPTARLKITNKFTDSQNVEQKFEEVIWQSSYDYENLNEGLVLYRGHGGMAMEDSLLDKGKEDWEKELLIPICDGVTLFKINVISGEQLLDRWGGPLPTGIRITLSFAEPFRNTDGSLDVAEEDKIVRTIAIDRTRKISFLIEGQEIQDSNEIGADKTPVGSVSNGKSSTGGTKTAEKTK